MVESLSKKVKSKQANEPKEESLSDSSQDDALMTREVQVIFKTTMPERYAVPET